MISGSVYFGLALTCGAYVVGCAVHRFAKTPLLNPLIVTNVLVIAFLALTGIAYDDLRRLLQRREIYRRPADARYGLPRDTALPPAPFAQEARRRDMLRHSGGRPRQLALHTPYVAALRLQLPKSITAAIAMPVCEELGGIPAITMLATVITGAFGYISAPALLKLVRVGDKVAKGVAIGSSSHAFGTLKAFEMGEAEGAMSSLAIAAAGLLTVAIAPFASLLFFWQ